MEEPKKNEEKYEFISEHVVRTPKEVVKGSKIRMVALVLCLAVFFGILASISYAISNGIFEYIAKKNNEEKREPIQLGSNSIETEHAIITDITQLAEKVQGAVVKVYSVSESSDGLFSETITSKEEYFGVVFADDGENYYVLTDYDSISTAKSLALVFEGGASTEGLLVGYNTALNIAVLVVKHADYYMEDFSQVTVLEFASAGSVQLGSAIMAIGAPNGIVGSIDYGIITSDDNSMPIADLDLNVSTTNLHYYAKSAGVVINMEGKICGIITDKFAENGVPSFMSTDNLINQIEYLANETFMLYTGVVCENVTAEVLDKAGCDNGIYVNKVEEGSPADNAGLRSGDMIITVNGNAVNTVEDYTSFMYEAGYEGKLELVIMRNGSEKNATITVDK